MKTKTFGLSIDSMYGGLIFFSLWPYAFVAYMLIQEFKNLYSTPTMFLYAAAYPVLLIAIYVCFPKIRISERSLSYRSLFISKHFDFIDVDKIIVAQVRNVPGQIAQMYYNYHYTIKADKGDFMFTSYGWSKKRTAQFNKILRDLVPGKIENSATY